MIFQKGGIGIVKSDFKNHLNFDSEWNGWIVISLLFIFSKSIFCFLEFPKVENKKKNQIFQEVNNY